MTTETLETTTADFTHMERALLADYLDPYNAKAETMAADIVEINLVDARSEFIRDICDAAGLSPGNGYDIEVIDAVIGREQSRFTRALALLQMRMVYADINDGPESKTGREYELCRKAYTEKMKGCASLLKGGRSTSTSKTFRVRL